MADIDPVEFGKLIAGMDNVVSGISGINHRLDQMNGKVNKAHERIDGVKTDLSGFKGKVFGAVALASAIWTWVLNRFL